MEVENNHETGGVGNASFDVNSLVLAWRSEFSIMVAVAGCGDNTSSVERSKNPSLTAGSLYLLCLTESRESFFFAQRK